MKAQRKLGSKRFFLKTPRYKPFLAAIFNFDMYLAAKVVTDTNITEVYNSQSDL